nr:MAG TPA: hypothetical protein [Caudoviricetes sp.]
MLLLIIYTAKLIFNFQINKFTIIFLLVFNILLDLNGELKIILYKI